MKSSQISIYISLIFLFIACNTADNVENTHVIKTDTSKSQIIDLESLIIPIIGVDTIENISSILDKNDTNFVQKSNDSIFSKKIDSKNQGLINQNMEVDKKHFLIGKWLVERRIDSSKITRGEEKVFVEYHQNSSFSMDAIGISGKWWVSDNLLFQKFEFRSNFSTDTSIIHLLNDSVLEVSEIKDRYKFILNKITE